MSNPLLPRPHCEALNDGGHDDWRLPNVAEMRSLIDLSVANPAWTIVPSPGNLYHWTSTTVPYFSNWAWVVIVKYGVIQGGYKENVGRTVQCVRGP